MTKPIQGPELQIINGGRSSSEPAMRWANIDSEAAVLSLVLVASSPGPDGVSIVSSQLDEVRPFLRPEHFYSEAHRRIYEAACAVRDQPDTKVDIITVGAKLRETNRLGQVGGMAYLTQVLNSAPAIGNVRAYARTVRDLWVLRQIRHLANEARTQCDVGTTGPDKILATLRERADALVEELSRGEKSGDMPDVLKRLWNEVDANQCNKNGGRGEIPTGFDRPDRATVGLTRGELTVIAARPGMGKTAYLTQMAENIASQRDKGDDEYRNGVMLFSLETQDVPLVRRMVCSRGRIELKRMRSIDRMTPDDWARAAKATDELSKLPIRIDDECAQTVSSIWAKARRYKMDLERRGKRLRMVGIDYLQLCRPARADVRSREQAVSENTRMLVAMAADLDCPVVALAQVKRDVDGRQDKRPMLSDLRESGEIEQAARTILFLYREAFYKKNLTPPESNMCEVIVAKQNSGETTTVMLGFDPQYLRFWNLPEGDRE